MFCHKLRRRPSYAPTISQLMSSLNLKENQLDTHDLAITLQANIDPRTGLTLSAKSLRILLLSPSSTSSANLESTIERIRHFAYISDEPNAIIFLLYPPHSHNSQPSNGETLKVAGTRAYTTLQTELLNHPDLPTIPLLPLTKLDSLPSLLNNHVSLLKSPLSCDRPSTAPLDLLKLCTLHQPMPQHTSNIFSDTFDNLRDVARAMIGPGEESSSSPNATCEFALRELDGRNEEGMEEKMRMLRDLVGEEEARELRDFWRGEYQV